MEVPRSVTRSPHRAPTSPRLHPTPHLPAAAQSTRPPASPTGDRGVKTVDTHTNMQVPCLSCVSAEPPPQAGASTSAPTRGGEHRGRPAPRPHPTRPLRHPSASRGEPTKTPTGRHEGNHAYTGQTQIRTPVCQPHRALPRTPRETPTPTPRLLHKGLDPQRRGEPNSARFPHDVIADPFAHQHDSHGTHEPTS